VDAMHSEIPTAAEINRYDSLDERCAVEHFLGKDLTAAEALFRENFLYYQEDLMWMGPRAFCYYVQAAIAYLLSPAANGDADAANAFCSVVESQLENDRPAIAPAIPRLRDAIESMLANFSRFGCDPQVYGDIESRYRALRFNLVS
jgi:hypothetical protein